MSRASKHSRWGALFFRPVLFAAMFASLLGGSSREAFGAGVRGGPGARYEARERRVVVDIDGNMTTAIHERVRLLTEEGAVAFRTVAIPSDLRFQRLSVTVARIVHPDGSETPAVISENQPWLVRASGGATLAFEGAGPSDLVDYSFVIAQPPLVPGHFWNVFVPGANAPVDRAVFSVDLPDATPFHFRNFGLSGTPAVTSGEGRRHYLFTFEDVAPAQGSGDPQAKVLVTSAGSWEPVVAWAVRTYFRQAELGAEAKGKVRELIAGIADEATKIKTLAAFVGSTIAYGNPMGGRSPFEPISASEVLHSAHGDCKDMTVLLVGMLHEAGIQAFPTLARRHPENLFADELPSPYYFDHAVVAIPDGRGEYLWLDPTIMAIEPARPPRDCVALVLKDGGFDLRQYTR